MMLVIGLGIALWLCIGLARCLSDIADAVGAEQRRQR